MISYHKRNPLSKDDREFLISGISPQGWIQLYGNEDEKSKKDEDVDDLDQNNQPFAD